MVDQGMSKTRRRVQKAIEEAEAEQRRLLLSKRIELAASGLKAFQNKKPVAAVRDFQTYIRILEDWKGVGEGGLNPSLFDRRKDAAELLLISGVYWDLVKLYDRTKSNEKRAEFLHYLEKYILFAKGMPSQALCAETLRKYLAIEKPRHMEDFKHAYKVLGVSKCFVATELSDCLGVDTMPRLRRFRDTTLRRSSAGRAFIRWYYRHGPTLAKGVSRLPARMRRYMALILDRISDRFLQ